MKKMILGAALALLSTLASTTASAIDVDDISFSIQTDKDTYSISSIDTNPIIVTLNVENPTHNALALTNGYGALGSVWMRPTESMDTNGLTSKANTNGFIKYFFPFTSTYYDGKRLRAAVAPWSCLGGNGHRDWGIGANSRMMLARLEIYKSDFNGATIMPGVYFIDVHLEYDLALKTSDEVGCSSGPYLYKTRRATALIKLK